MKSSLDLLAAEAESMNAKGAMAAVGIHPDRPESLKSLVEVLEEHELGATPRAVMVYVRGYLQRLGLKLDDVVGDDEHMTELKRGLPASSSISRAIPLAVTMQEHLVPYWNNDETTIIDLGSGRAHASQVFLYPRILKHEFFEKYRVSLNPELVPAVDRVIAVDNRDASWEDASQVYYKPDGTPTEKIDAMQKLESFGDYDGELIKILADIRTLDKWELLALAEEKATNRVIFLNNVLYAVQDEVRREIEEAVDEIAYLLGADIMQMEGWNVFYDKKPEIILPGRDKPLVLPAFVRVGKSLDQMKVVAELDGNTGKPFNLVTRRGEKVFIDDLA